MSISSFLKQGHTRRRSHATKAGKSFGKEHAHTRCPRSDCRRDASRTTTGNENVSLHLDGNGPRIGYSTDSYGRRSNICGKCYRRYRTHASKSSYKAASIHSDIVCHAETPSCVLHDNILAKVNLPPEHVNTRFWSSLYRTTSSASRRMVRGGGHRHEFASPHPSVSMLECVSGKSLSEAISMP